jgi:hypothetical protein
MQVVVVLQLALLLLQQAVRAVEELVEIQQELLVQQTLVAVVVLVEITVVLLLEHLALLAAQAM